ncbi:MAG TPA: aldose 1-epimerase family protein [Clostridiales bacterium]|nr:aldose 1-epimerase family protein [Clostridiales bacterium]
MLTKRELERYCGDLTQVFGIQECILEGGKAKGIKAYILNNGTGLRMTVLADKCFTIPSLSFKEINIGFISKTGICAPEYYQEEGTRGFLRNFEAGFLTTCGLTYMGSPCEVGGQKNGLHGMISNTPMENVSAQLEWDEDNGCICLSGTAREGFLFGPNIHIKKQIRIPIGQNVIEIHDQIENVGFDESPLMLLYHFNYGYPFLDENCEIFCNYDKIMPRDVNSEGRMDTLNTFEKPIPGFKEIVALRTMSDLNETEGKSLVYNKKLKIAVSMNLNAHQLPIMNQWKSPRAGDYVLGMEPGTGHVGGLVETEKDGLLMKIGPGEKKEFDIIIEFLDEPERIQKNIKGMKTQNI